MTKCQLVCQGGESNEPVPWRPGGRAASADGSGGEGGRGSPATAGGARPDIRLLSRGSSPSQVPFLSSAPAGGPRASDWSGPCKRAGQASPRPVRGCPGPEGGEPPACLTLRPPGGPTDPPSGQHTSPRGPRFAPSPPTCTSPSPLPGTSASRSSAWHLRRARQGGGGARARAPPRHPWGLRAKRVGALGPPPTKHLPRASLEVGGRPREAPTRGRRLLVPHLPATSSLSPAQPAHADAQLSWAMTLGWGDPSVSTRPRTDGAGSPEGSFPCLAASSGRVCAHVAAEALAVTHRPGGGLRPSLPPTLHGVPSFLPWTHDWGGRGSSGRRSRGSGPGGGRAGRPRGGGVSRAPSAPGRSLRGTGSLPAPRCPGWSPCPAYQGAHAARGRARLTEPAPSRVGTVLGPRSPAFLGTQARPSGM